MLKITPNPLTPTERAGRTIAGVVMIGAAFFDGGRWVVAMLGALFLISAWLGDRPERSGGCGCCGE